MKRIIRTSLVVIGLGFIAFVVFLAAHNIRVPGAEGTVVQTIRVDTIYEGGVKDIVFAQNDGRFYYINRGLEQGFTLEGLRTELLNKTVTLHVPNVLAGPSNHISKLELDGKEIFNENTHTYN